MSFFRVQGLRKSYHTPSSSVDVLKELELELSAGEFLAIVGESGSGKSTLLQILGTLDEADAGRILLNGTSLSGLSAAAKASLRNHQLGFVYQAHHLIPELTALENVMLPLMIRGSAEAAAKASAIRLLDRLKLGQRIDHTPARLSGGEAQRVAVARALIGKPDLLLADEPTGNLDEETADAVFQLMRQLCREEQAAVIMVTHSQALAAKTDRVLKLQHGRLH